MAPQITKQETTIPEHNPLLDHDQIGRLQKLLSRLIQNYTTQDVTVEISKLRPEDIRTLVDFLDLILGDHPRSVPESDEQARALLLLLRITTSSHVFPQRHELKDIKYDPRPFAQGGFGSVYQGTSNPNVCVKIRARIDHNNFNHCISEMIPWAYSSHPNVLPFYGMFIDDLRGICLVSPFMKNGTLHDYSPRLPQKSRLPLLYDIAWGLLYLHGRGIIHGNLKTHNVLISDEGRALIAGFHESISVPIHGEDTSTYISTAFTLRFASPEQIQDHDVQRTKNDIWSFGCICYTVLSRKLPYYEYRSNAQVSIALFRGQLPRRPGGDDLDWNNDNEQNSSVDRGDWDEIDDQAWGMITKCLRPNPGDRLQIPEIQQLLADMIIRDTRPERKAFPRIEHLKVHPDPHVDLNRAEELLHQLQQKLNDYVKD